MLTALLIIATLTLSYITIKSITYEIRKGHATHIDTTQEDTLALVPAHTDHGGRR